MPRKSGSNKLLSYNSSIGMPTAKGMLIAKKKVTLNSFKGWEMKTPFLLVVASVVALAGCEKTTVVEPRPASSPPAKEVVPVPVPGPQGPAGAQGPKGEPGAQGQQSEPGAQMKKEGDTTINVNPPPEKKNQ